MVVFMLIISTISVVVLAITAFVLYLTLRVYTKTLRVLERNFDLQKVMVEIQLRAARIQAYGHRLDWNAEKSKGISTASAKGKDLIASIICDLFTFRFC